MVSAGVKPASVHRVSIASARWSHRELERLAEPERLMRHESVDLVVGHHHLVAKRINERGGDRGGERRHQADPP